MSKKQWAAMAPLAPRPQTPWHVVVSVATISGALLLLLLNAYPTAHVVTPTADHETVTASTLPLRFASDATAYVDRHELQFVDGGSGNGSCERDPSATNASTLKPTVATRYGLVRGMIDLAAPDVVAFLGIPYAQPPTGPRRFARAQPPHAWNTTTTTTTASSPTRTLLAHRHAPVCPQLEFFPRQSEDCLYLSVYTPRMNFQDESSAARRLLPVVVYMYGGGFFLGSGSEHRIYDGSYLVQRQVWRGEEPMVVVNFNYRTGALGFVTTDHVTPNLGLYDQQAALRWVHENIRAFNGDPRRVTVWGQSAGALSALLHATSPSSQRYFSRVISHSPPLGLHLRTEEEARAVGRRLIKNVGCARDGDTDAEHACLMKVSVRKLVYAHRPVSMPGLSDSGRVIGDVLTWYPVVDGDLVRSSSSLEGKDATLPSEVSTFRTDLELIIGTLRDEAFIVPWALDRFNTLARFFLSGDGNSIADAQSSLFFMERFHENAAVTLTSPLWTRAAYIQLLRFLFKKDYRRVLGVYPLPPPSRSNNDTSTAIADLFWTMMSDYVFHCPTRTLLRDLGNNRGDGASGPRAFAYHMNVVPDYLAALSGSCATSRACHAVDLPYMFHAPSSVVTFTPAEQRFSERMLDYWLPFMRGDVMHEIDNGNDDQWTAFGSGKASGDYLNMTMGRDNGAVDDTQSADPPWTMVRGEFEKRCTLWDDLGYHY